MISLIFLATVCQKKKDFLRTKFAFVWMVADHWSACMLEPYLYANTEKQSTNRSAGSYHCNTLSTLSLTQIHIHIVVLLKSKCKCEQRLSATAALASSSLCKHLLHLYKYISHCIQIHFKIETNITGASKTSLRSPTMCNYIVSLYCIAPKSLKSLMCFSCQKMT